jgi:hypothetical protein
VVLAELDRIEAALPAGPPDDRVITRLRSLLSRWQDVAPDLAAATDEELFEALDNELGRARGGAPG